MKKIILLFSVSTVFGLMAQTEIAPYFAPTDAPSTYLGNFSTLFSPGDDIPTVSSFTEEGDVASTFGFTCDDGSGSYISMFSGIGNYCGISQEAGMTRTLISPEMDFGVYTSSPTLSFRYIIDDGGSISPSLDGWYEISTLEVMYKESAGGAWNVLDSYTGPDNLWYDISLDLSAASSISTFYIGFRVTTPNTAAVWDYGLLAIDEVVVTGVDGGGGCSPTASSFSVSMCDSYTVPSGDATYTTSGTVMDTIPNAGGCDSVMTINVSVLTATSSSFSASDCNSYTVPSGDETYTISGTYTDTIPNSAGCDSVMTIDVTIGSPDVSISLTGITLTAAATGLTYQWIDCSDMSPVSGATNQDFTPDADGNYAVIVSDGSCSDTSACTSVAGVGIGENIKNVFSLYPNPANDQLFVRFSENQTAATLELLSMDGKQVLQQKIPNGSLITLSISDLKPGIYAVRITGGENTSTKLFTKQ